VLQRRNCEFSRDSICCSPQFHQIREGLFCEGAENYAVSQSSHHILNDDDGRQRVSRAQRLRNQLGDYFLTSAGAILFQ
jgi:hypothetical protein